MKAARLVHLGKPGTFEISQIAAPEPGPDDVVVKVAACGLNHLDLWLEEGGLPVAVALPRTPGCEVAGEVARVGAGVTQWRVGDRVAIQSNIFCGECSYCHEGEESVCLKGELLGIQRDGGFAEEVLVPARCLVALPRELPFESAAALGLAASTAMHMLTHRATVRAGDWVLVIGGASGVGSAAIQIARQLGARVISTGSTAEKRELAKQLGAEAVVNAGDPSWTAEVRRVTNKRGVDLVVEHVGGDLLRQCFDCLARNGTIVTCGATAGRDVSLNLWPLFVKQQRLIGSYGRNRKDLEATLQWAAAGKIRAVIDRVLPLEQTAEAFRLLRERQVNGKIVVKP